MAEADRGTADPAERGGGRMLLLFSVAALVWVIDLASKLAVVRWLDDGSAVGIAGSWMELRVTRNSGAAFGMGGAVTMVFTLAKASAAVAVAVLARRVRSTPWAVALGLVMGGALGNLTDRVFRAPGGLRGAVVDFIAVRDFSVMNLADWGITCGAALVVLLSFRGRTMTGVPAEPAVR